MFDCLREVDFEGGLWDIVVGCLDFEGCCVDCRLGVRWVPYGLWGMVVELIWVGYFD